MTMCAKCWSDANALARLEGSSVVDEYYRLLKEREKTPCSEEEQRWCTDSKCPQHDKDGR